MSIAYYVVSCSWLKSKNWMCVVLSNSVTFIGHTVAMEISRITHPEHTLLTVNSDLVRGEFGVLKCSAVTIIDFTFKCRYLGNSNH